MNQRGGDLLLGKYGKILVGILLVFGITVLAFGYLGGRDKTDENILSDEERYTAELEEILSGVEGIGKMKIMVSCEKVGDKLLVNGVAILCQGGDDPMVVKDVIGIVGAVCGVPSNKIYVGHMGN
jgi:hypothetical protein